MVQSSVLSFVNWLAILNGDSSHLWPPTCHTAVLYIHVWLLYPCGVKWNFTSEVIALSG